jgi:hypothetical protein
VNRLSTIAATLAVAALGGAGTASAQAYTNYPVCAVYGGARSSVTSCAFMNFAQCQMSVSGRGGYCEANVWYQPPRARRKARRAR